MGHADIQTTMIYVHHQPKATAAGELTRLVSEATAGEDGAMSGVGGEVGSRPLTEEGGGVR
jgi:hypothetical protein